MEVWEKLKNTLTLKGKWLIEYQLAGPNPKITFVFCVEKVRETSIKPFDFVVNLSHEDLTQLET
jgi:hypothetical protein